MLEHPLMFEMIVFTLLIIFGKVVPSIIIYQDLVLSNTVPERGYLFKICDKNRCRQSRSKNKHKIYLKF